jgi:TadE-like protein
LSEFFARGRPSAIRGPEDRARARGWAVVPRMVDSATDEPAPAGKEVAAWVEERAAGERGSAVVEFVLVSAVAVVLALALAQLGLFLWERNALMGSLSEGARVAATEGRTVADGRLVATELLRRSAGGRVARAVPIQGVETGGMVVLRAEGTLPSFVPGVPGLPVRMTARMHEEEAL